MKLKLNAIIFIAMVFLLPIKSDAQQILAFKFLPQDNGKQWSNPSTTTNANLEKSELTRGKGAQDNTASSVRSMVANLVSCKNRAEAVKADAYYEFFVHTKPGYTISLKDLKVILRVQENSADTYRWVYSIDDGDTFKDLGNSDIKITNLDNEGAQQEPINLSSHTDLQNIPSGKKVIFRLYAWGGTASSGNNRAFGLGKSSSQGSNAISLTGYVVATK